AINDDASGRRSHPDGIWHGFAETQIGAHPAQFRNKEMHGRTRDDVAFLFVEKAARKPTGEIRFELLQLLGTDLAVPFGHARETDDLAAVTAPGDDNRAAANDIRVSLAPEGNAGFSQFLD